MSEAESFVEGLKRQDRTVALALADARIEVDHDGTGEMGNGTAIAGPGVG